MRNGDGRSPLPNADPTWNAKNNVQRNGITRLGTVMADWLTGSTTRVQLVRYFAVAGGIQLLYLCIMASFLLLGWHYVGAIAAAQVLTVAAAFHPYRIWVFESRGRAARDLPRFLAVWSGGAFAGFVLTPALVEFLAMPPFPAQTLAIVLVSSGSFLAHRLFSFGAHR